jgi:excinuclease ABC subunit A
MTNDKYIRILGARQNNLKDLNLDLPREQLIAITGVSGSGKSSLALETLYAEGQRRYVETFSPYARQFLDRLDRPQVENIVGIPPAIAIEQGNRIKSSRSTVGTITEIADHLKLLYAQAGVLLCQHCNRPVHEDTPQTIWASLSDVPNESQILIAFPLTTVNRSREEVRNYLWRHGFRRLWHERGIVNLDEESVPDKESVDVLVDRIVWSSKSRKRIIDSLEQALYFGEGKIFFPQLDTAPFVILAIPHRHRISSHSTVPLALARLVEALAELSMWTWIWSYLTKVCLWRRAPSSRGEQHGWNTTI